MRSVISVLVPLLVLLLTSCSSDSDPFGPYKTAFKIKAGCTLNVEKSKVSAKCSDVTIEADLNTEVVNLTSATFKETLKNTTCYEERICTMVYRGVANKKGGTSTKDSGAAADKGKGDGSAPHAAPDTADGGAAGDTGPAKSSNKGLFTPLEGEWEGKLRLDKSCTIKAKSGAPEYCNTTAKETIQYSFKATVTRHEAAFTWTGDNGSGGTFKVLETKGGVRAADKFYPRVDLKPSSDGGASKADGM